MESVSGKMTIVFNGEIYNYKEIRDLLIKEGMTFRTNTDSEVIINAYERYGEKCLDYFDGMFAFVIYDQTKDLLFIGRDRLGVKPLYYYFKDELFIFASEIKAILEFPEILRSVNYSCIQQYVMYRYVKNPDTLFNNIFKLQPGHYIILKDLSIKVHKYWDINCFDKEYECFNDALSEFEHLFEDSVKIRMISDVPIGAFLSGGIDSSLIVALMAKHTSLPINTFSVGFNEKTHNELKYASLIAKLFQTNHTELIVTQTDFVDNIYNTVWHRDAPVSETSDIPIYLLSKLSKKTVSVILTGEGSDELFGGYPKHSYDRIADTRLFNILLKNKLAAGVINLLPYRFRREKQAYHNLCSDNAFERYIGWFSSFHPRVLSNVLSQEFSVEYLSEFSYDYPTLLGKTKLDRMLYYDLKYWLTDDLLERGDKMMMAGGIEGRYPFLDYRIAECSFRLNDEYRIKGLNRKYIVKKLSEKYIPKEIINRKKVGFYSPIGDWFKKKGKLKELVCEHLLSNKFQQRGIFNYPEVEKMLKLHFNSEKNFEKEIWTLLNLEIWFRLFID